MSQPVLVTVTCIVEYKAALVYPVVDGSVDKRITLAGLLILLPE